MPKEFSFDATTDRYGWTEDADGKWAYGLFVEGGRLRADEKNRGRLALKKIAEEIPCQFRLTANQNVIIARVNSGDKTKVEKILEDYDISLPQHLSGIRLNSIACTALPTCSLALAESERYLPTLVDELEQIIEGLGLRNQSIAIRSTGCPNGCGRPYLGEIGLVGKSPGKYNLYLGAGLDGTRLNKLYRAAITHEEIVNELKPILQDYASSRIEDEKFGDFCIRKNYVQPTLKGTDFHD